MKINEKQLVIMFDVLKESQRIIGGMAGYSQETLNQLVNAIINQQSDELFDVE